MWAWLCLGLAAGLFDCVLVGPVSAVGQVVAVGGGSQPWAKICVSGGLPGHAVGRCRATRRVEDESSAGTAMSLWRIVAVVALASAG